MAHPRSPSFSFPASLCNLCAPCLTLRRKSRCPAGRIWGWWEGKAPYDFIPSTYAERLLFALPETTALHAETPSHRSSAFVSASCVANRQVLGWPGLASQDVRSQGLFFGLGKRKLRAEGCVRAGRLSLLIWRSGLVVGLGSI